MIQTLLITFYFLVSISLQVDVTPCDPLWNFNEETGCCYKTTPTASTWFDGTSMCAKLRLGAQMASLHSQNESKWVAKTYRNGLDGIHAWTGLSQTKIANNWTYTDGSKPWSWFHTQFFFLHNHTSCVEIVDNWLVELFQNSGKTQPTFCYHYLKSLCKYCPVPPMKPIGTTTPTIKANTTTTVIVNQVAKLEKAQPRGNVIIREDAQIAEVITTTIKPTITTTTTVKPMTTTKTITTIKPTSVPTTTRITTTTARPTTITTRIQTSSTTTTRAARIQRQDVGHSQPPKTTAKPVSTTTLHKLVAGREFDFPKGPLITSNTSISSTTTAPHIKKVPVVGETKTLSTSDDQQTIQQKKTKKGCEVELERIGER